jgi:hypothetical protein
MGTQVDDGGAPRLVTCDFLWEALRMARLLLAFLAAVAAVAAVAAARRT